MHEEKQISLDEMLPVILQTIEQGHSVRFSPRGNSMRPMLMPGRDKVTLTSPPEQLRKFDLPLYRRENGAFVLHRVVAVREDCYLCLGDNTEVFERVEKDRILAVVASFTRKGREIRVGSFWYRVYCILWRPMRLPRKLFKKFRRLAGRCLK